MALPLPRADQAYRNVPPLPGGTSPPAYYATALLPTPKNTDIQSYRAGNWTGSSYSAGTNSPSFLPFTDDEKNVRAVDYVDFVSKEHDIRYDTAQKNLIRTFNSGFQPGQGFNHLAALARFYKELYDADVKMVEAAQELKKEIESGGDKKKRTIEGQGLVYTSLGEWSNFLLRRGISWGIGGVADVDGLYSVSAKAMHGDLAREIKGMNDTMMFFLAQRKEDVKAQDHDPDIPRLAQPDSVQTLADVEAWKRLKPLALGWASTSSTSDEPILPVGPQIAEKIRNLERRLDGQGFILKPNERATPIALTSSEKTNAWYGAPYDRSNVNIEWVPWDELPLPAGEPMPPPDKIRDKIIEIMKSRRPK